jgi:hypothetical protein
VIRLEFFSISLSEHRTAPRALGYQLKLITMPRRPYLQENIKELEARFKSTSSTKELALILHELNFRKTNAAIHIKEQVREVLKATESTTKSPALTPSIAPSLTSSLPPPSQHVSLPSIHKQIPVTIKNKVVLWQNRPVEHDDFIAIRTYVDACLKPERGPTTYDTPLTTNFTSLLHLVTELDKTIPRPSPEELSKALPEIPPPPTLPSTPDIVGMKITKKDTKKIIATLTQRIRYYEARIKTGQTSARHDLDRQANHKKALVEYTMQLEQWEEANDEYNRELPQFKQKVSYHEHLKTTYQSSFPHKRIINRLVHDLESTIANGGLSFEQVKWQLLPEGEPLNQSINRYLIAAKRRYPHKIYEDSRITQIISLKPNKAYIGKSEFDGYIVFLFNYSPYAVLECPWFGNALYLLKKDNWASLSKFTKSTLLHHQSRHTQRIIHDPDGNWIRRLKRQIHP